jgi:hypothetical protein
MAKIAVRKQHRENPQAKERVEDAAVRTERYAIPDMSSAEIDYRLEAASIRPGRQIKYIDSENEEQPIIYHAYSTTLVLENPAASDGNLLITGTPNAIKYATSQLERLFEDKLISLGVLEE